MTCPKDFRCAAIEPEHPGKAGDIGIDSYLECLDKEPWSCQLAVYVDGEYFCDCAERVYIAAKLAK